MTVSFHSGRLVVARTASLLAMALGLGCTGAPSLPRLEVRVARHHSRGVNSPRTTSWAEGHIALSVSSASARRRPRARRREAASQGTVAYARARRSPCVHVPFCRRLRRLELLELRRFGVEP